eukprot:CAMPEP_0174921218 /NCGR_PEP_ID=MMETSP1355-20121228/4999_1 /TAXON_ID=464990 /ORGANISM="Hemiselmis tepida, Strain CCMP443" /LENGTH=218 /DNA_ID=CAMNT_0016166677 /DNA_START=198 /DNA_END=853 /DNA_ORIENTATION=-
MLVDQAIDKVALRHRLAQPHAPFDHYEFLIRGVGTHAQAHRPCPTASGLETSARSCTWAFFCEDRWLLFGEDGIALTASRTLDASLLRASAEFSLSSAALAARSESREALRLMVSRAAAAFWSTPSTCLASSGNALRSLPGSCASSTLICFSLASTSRLIVLLAPWGPAVWSVVVAVPREAASALSEAAGRMRCAACLAEEKASTARFCALALRAASA